MDCLRFLITIQAITAAKIPSTATPPKTPPIMGPIGLELLEEGVVEEDGVARISPSTERAVDEELTLMLVVLVSELEVIVLLVEVAGLKVIGLVPEAVGVR